MSPSLAVMEWRKGHSKVPGAGIWTRPRPLDPQVFDILRSHLPRQKHTDDKRVLAFFFSSKRHCQNLVAAG